MQIWQFRLLPWSAISKRCGISFIIWTFLANLFPVHWRLDEELSDYVEELWANGDGLAQAQCTLGALHHFAPQLRGRISGAWKKLKTWRRHEMHRRAPPIPPALLRGIAGLAWVQGRLDVALGILIGFHCMLRGGEVSSFVTVGTLVIQLYWTSVSPNQDREKEPENKSRSQTVHSPVCFGISVVIERLQNVWCVCLHPISGNTVRACFLSSVSAKKVTPCIPSGAVVLHFFSV